MKLIDWFLSFFEPPSGEIRLDGKSIDFRDPDQKPPPEYDGPKLEVKPVINIKEKPDD